LNLLQTIREKTLQSPNSGDEAWEIFTELFRDTAFIEELLNAPARWGKERYPSIMELIKAVGPLLVEPLLDRLAEEGNRARRQFYLDLLVSLGTVVRDAAIKRLQDNRWYVLRNMITILGKLDDPSVVKSLYHLLDNPHPRVRQELLQTLIKHNDPRADRLLLEEIDSQDLGRCLRAMMMAGKSRSEEVSQRLLGILRRKWLTKKNFEMKKAVVQTLADRGDPAVLPVLQSILRSHPLFFRKHAKLLKVEIIQSLGKYPAQEASAILNNVANSRSRELGNQASIIMKSIKARGV
jgi:HEAT repeat protein